MNSYMLSHQGMVLFERIRRIKNYGLVEGVGYNVSKVYDNSSLSFSLPMIRMLLLVIATEPTCMSPYFSL